MKKRVEAPEIHATISVSLTHRAGPVVEDPSHVISWICADGMLVGGQYNGFTFEVCPQHADPDECDCTGAVSIYAASIDSADLDES